MHSEAWERAKTSLQLWLPLQKSSQAWSLPPSPWRTTSDYSQQDSVICVRYYKSNAQLLYLINAWILIVNRCSNFRQSIKGHLKLWDLPDVSVSQSISITVVPAFLQTSVFPALQFLLLYFFLFLKVLPCSFNSSVTYCGVLDLYCRM